MLGVSACIYHFECTNNLLWVFLLCFYLFFCVCYCKMSVVGFLLVSIMHFVACFHMCRTNVFMGSFDCYVHFWVKIYNSMLALFFAIVLFIALYFFLSNCTDSLFLHFAGFSAVPHPRFEQLPVRAFSFLLLLYTFYYYYSAICFFFCLVVVFNDTFFGSFRACLFCCVNQRVETICACSFSFFWGALFVFFALLFLINIHIVPNASSFP